MAQTKPKAGQFYGVSNNGTDGQFLKTDGTGGMSWDSPITNPTITSIDYPGSTTAADPAGGQSVIINGTLFASGVTCTVGGTSAVTAFNSATQITITTPAKAAGPYTVAVTNTNGGTAYQANFIQYSGVPVWSTAAGTLGNVLEGGAASFQVTATEGSDTIEYAVTTGTLPTGLSLATATGAITGTAGSVSADTTTTFSITATDDENQTSSERSFSITVQNDAASNHFDTVLYSGNGGTQSITGLNFSPGLVWIKKRNATEDHAWFDTIRGTQQQISSNLSSADYTTSNALSSFNSDGFTTGNNGATNNSSGTYVAWNFKAGGTAVTNTDGNITSSVSANQNAGFSIVSYAGNNGASATIGHGLSSAPELVIIKARNFAAGWPALAAPNGTITYARRLNDSGAGGSSYESAFFNSTAPTNSVFSIGNSDEVNDGYNYIAYCWHSVSGYSKIGSYSGTGAAGNIITTGFEPAFLMFKSSSSGQWWIYDNKRGDTKRLFAETNAAESTSTSLTTYANGFGLNDANGNLNASGVTYNYLAIAADGSTATPSLANSFATEIYTGNGGTQAITTGFKPGLTWIKSRTDPYDHNLYDIIRGADGQSGSSDKVLMTNKTNAQEQGSGDVTITNNGVTVVETNTGGSGQEVNKNNSTYVSWNWKAGGTPSINTDGTITSVVSANQAAGFSIVGYTTQSSGTATVGHGLSSPPDMVIVKTTTVADSWRTYNSSLGAGFQIYLNLTNAAGSTSNQWNNTAPTSSVFTLGTDNAGSYPSVAYCFTSIPGYSKVGTYTGLGSSGPLTVNVGFAPTLVIIKRTDSTGTWRMFDTVRGTDKSLRANSSDAEYDDVSNYVDFTSTGFYFNTSQANPDINASGGTYIYLAIKEN